MHMSKEKLGVCKKNHHKIEIFVHIYFSFQDMTIVFLGHEISHNWFDGGQRKIMNEKYN